MEVPALEPSVDFALLADALHASGGKLYVLGGGWDTLWVRSFPARHHTLAIGARIRVPWTLADRPMQLTIDLVDEDGHQVFNTLRHEFKVSRPRGLPDGSDIGVVRAFTFNNVPFEKAGGYGFLLAIDGEERKRLRFQVRLRQEP